MGFSQNSLCSWGDANHFFRACAEFAGDSPQEQNRNLRDAQQLESPIELVMFAALITAVKTGKVIDPEEIIAKFECDLYVQIQTAQPIGRYRADLVVTAKTFSTASGPLPSIVVECDGFNYHDRTRDQACRDRERDRYMMHRGLLVMRFTGEEIVDAPFSCAAEVLSIAHAGAIRFDRDDPKNGQWPVFQRRHGASNESGPPQALGEES